MDAGKMKNLKQQSTSGSRYSHTVATESWHSGGSIAAAVDFTASDGSREIFSLLITTINWWQRLPEMPCYWLQQRT